MSDETTTTTQTTNAGSGQTVATPTPGAQTPAEPQPFAVFETEKSFSKRVERDARKQMNEFAKEQGFTDWQHMSDTLATLRQGASGQPPAAGAQQPVTPAQQGPDEATRLRMALQVGAKLNLPAAIVSRLQGATAEEMEADAQALVNLMGGQQRGPGIPNAPTQGQPVTFTSAQLQDPKFVREHAAAIQQAAREGRIVRS